MEAITHSFQVGRLYNRQKDIHGVFGGSRQSGISPSRRFPVIFLFTSDLGHQYGYSDQWTENVFHYTGEGQNGDMIFTKGNKAIRDHVKDGKSLLLFKHLGKGKMYQYMGEFVCESFEWKAMPDIQGHKRKGIVFHLITTDGKDTQALPLDLSQLSLKELRKKAYDVSSEVTATTQKEGVRRYYERNFFVKAYVLARANGTCECCGMPAPFLKRDGTPYLEPHHIRQLSDQGLDRPDWVAAITPNCHREIHHGKKGKEKNEQLALIVQKKERFHEDL